MNSSGDAFHRSALVTSVIGGAGFIGRNLIDMLSAAGVFSYVFTRQNPFAHGGRLHQSLLRSATIFYVAGSTTPASAERDPRRVADDHRILQVLLRGLQEANHCPLVVLASSGGTVYDPDAALPYREDSPIRPVSAYGAAKLAQEEELVASADWTTPVILRFANIYGPGQSSSAGYGVIAYWLQAVLAGSPLRMIGQSRRDYLHVSDASAAMLMVHRNADCFRSTRAPTTLNIGSGVPTSLDELHSHLERAVGHPLAMRREPARAFDRMDVWLDIESAGRAIGWKPKIGLMEGLADTLAAAYGNHAVRRSFYST